MELKHLGTGDALTLPDDLLWADEHAWTPAVSNISYLLTGALLVESGSRQAGRPITLVGAPDMAWVPRSTVAKLHNWACAPEQRFALRLADYRLFTVTFRHQEQPVETEPVLGFPARSERDWYRLTLRLMAV